MDSLASNQVVEAAGDLRGGTAALGETARATVPPGLDAQGRSLSGTQGAEWPPASAAALDRAGSTAEISHTRPLDTAGTVERLSKLMSRETMVLRQHASESMAVVLRPDASTELLVHLTQRNGQIEAHVRCERGDFQHLNALWSQLQESLANQKVRLNPLQESAGDPSSSFSYSGGQSGDQGARGDTSRQARSENDSLEAWLNPASPDQNPAVRGRRESGNGLSTSRPGWETWA